MDYFPRNPHIHPFTSTPPDRQGARRPLPVYSPPVFRLTSTEILNVLYTPGPCVSPGEGGLEVGSFSALGSRRHQPDNGPRAGLGTLLWGLPLPLLPRLHAPSGHPWCSLSCQMLPVILFSRSHACPRFEIQAPARVPAAGTPTAAPFPGRRPWRRPPGALGPSALSSRGAPALCVEVALSCGVGLWMHVCLWCSQRWWAGAGRKGDPGQLSERRKRRPSC